MYKISHNHWRKDLALKKAGNGSNYKTRHDNLPDVTDQYLDQTWWEDAYICPNPLRVSETMVLERIENIKWK